MCVWRNVSLEAEKRWNSKECGLWRGRHIEKQKRQRLYIGVSLIVTATNHHKVLIFSSFLFHSTYIWSKPLFFQASNNHQQSNERNEFFFFPNLLIHLCRVLLHKILFLFYTLLLFIHFSLTFLLMIFSLTNVNLFLFSDFSLNKKKKKNM